MAVNNKLVVDKKKNKVAFAECEADFVDVLFSFLTLPLGTLVRLLDKKSGIRCFDMLYQSVENLKTDHFQTDSCKSMLLQPRSTAERVCEDLTIRIDDLNPRRLFRCWNWDCYLKNHRHYSSVGGVKCPCGQLMDKNNLEWVKKKTEGSGIFVESTASFIVSDDLHVQVLSSVGPSVSLLQNLGIMDLSVLEEITIQVNKSQVLHLLKRSLVSRTPLTDVFLKDPNNVDAVKTEIFGTTIKCENNKVPVQKKLPDNNQSEGIKVKILESKSAQKTLLLQSGNDFVDLLFSFLTFPLGSALSFLGETYFRSTVGCIGHIYSSLIDFKDATKEILSPQTKDMLLNPNLPPYFSCSNQILKVDEMKSNDCEIHSCRTCYVEEKPKCLHGMQRVKVTELNPKLKETSSEYGGGFVRTSARFMIANTMIVKPMSSASTVQLLKDLGVSSLEGLREREITIQETEALSLLMDCLTSNAILTGSFRR